MARLEYLPALDGLRGACLLAVLFFHSGFAWMSGGFLGVSTFFTLSGYLITTLLLDERAATGTFRQSVLARYPWISAENLTQLWTQGRYYAWKDGELE